MITRKTYTLFRDNTAVITKDGSYYSYKEILSTIDEIFKNISFWETLKFEKVTGSSNSAEAKIAGITPAELILSGKCDDSPPYILFPICLLG